MADLAPVIYGLIKGQWVYYNAERSDLRKRKLTLKQRKDGSLRPWNLAVDPAQGESGFLMRV